MAVEWVVVSGALLLAICYGLGLYNSLVAVNHVVSSVLENMEVLRRQRHAALLHLLDVCKPYAVFEDGSFQRVVLAHAAVQAAAEQGDLAALGCAEALLRARVERLLDAAQKCPALVGDANFLALQNHIRALDCGITERRTNYNEAARTNNVLLDSYPDKVIAGWFRFAKRPLLEFSAEAAGEGQ